VNLSCEFVGMWNQWIGTPAELEEILMKMHRDNKLSDLDIWNKQMSSTYKIEDKKLIRTQTTEMDLQLVIDILSAIHENNNYWWFRDGYKNEFDTHGKFRWRDMYKLVEMGLLKNEVDSWRLTYILTDSSVLSKVIRDLTINNIIDEE